MKVTILEVAKELGLSRNTVAKALANSETVAYDTRREVIEKANEMGYQKISPAVAAEFHVKRAAAETKTIAVLNRHEIAMFWNRIIVGMSEELGKYNCKLQLCFVSVEDEAAGRISEEELANVDGLLVLSVFEESIMKRIENLRLPTVYLDMSCEYARRPKKGDVILCEGAYSVACLTEHLIKQGIRKIGFIGDITYCTTNKDRFDGYIQTLRAAGITPDDGIMAVSHKPYRYYIQEETEAAIDSFSSLPEAIVCVNDDIAWFTIRYLRKKGIRVPEEVAVTGFDNVEEIAQVDAFLTTVRVGNHRLGRRMVQQLMWRMENPDFPQEIIHVGVDIIYRLSSEKSGQPISKN